MAALMMTTYGRAAGEYLCQHKAVTLTNGTLSPFRGSFFCVHTRPFVWYTSRSTPAYPERKGFSAKDSNRKNIFVYHAHTIWYYIVDISYRILYL